MGDERICIYTSSSNDDVSYLSPIVMQNCETFGRDAKYENTPNCLVKPAKLSTDCQKITPVNFKKVTILGYQNEMIIEAISPYQTDGHKFHYNNSSPIPKDIHINFGAMPDIIPVRQQKSIEPIMKLEIPTPLLKNIAKLGKLSDRDMKVFFEKNSKGDCMKIMTEIKNYAIVYTYIMPQLDTI